MHDTMHVHNARNMLEQKWSRNSANDLRHKHAHALHGLIQWLSVYQSEHCSVLHRITISDPTLLPHAHTFAVMWSRCRAAPHLATLAWYGTVRLHSRYACAWHAMHEHGTQYIWVKYNVREIPYFDLFYQGTQHAIATRF